MKIDIVGDGLIIPFLSGNGRTEEFPAGIPLLESIELCVLRRNLDDRVLLINENETFLDFGEVPRIHMNHRRHTIANISLRIADADFAVYAIAEIQLSVNEQPVEIRVWDEILAAPLHLDIVDVRHLLLLFRIEAIVEVVYDRLTTLFNVLFVLAVFAILHDRVGDTGKRAREIEVLEDRKREL